MRIILLSLFAFYSYNLDSQDLPDFSSILSISPKWIYVSEDTNWYKIQLEDNYHFDQYFGSFYHNSVIKNNHFYLLEALNGQTHSPSLSEGYFLHKLDINTGKPDWIHFDNFYSGNDFVETVFGGNMHFNQDGNIVVNGFKSLDSIKNISFEIFDSRVHVNVMRDVINDHNGHLLEHRVDLDTSRTINKLHPGGFLLRKVSNNRQVKHKFENVFEDSLVRNYLHFYDVDEAGIASDTPVFSYKHNTIIEVDNPMWSYPNIYYQINENSGVAIFGSLQINQGNIPADLKLVFFDTSNSPNIVVTEERDIYNLLPQNLHNATGFTTIRGKDGYFYIAQKVRVTNSNEELDKYVWMQWYDAAGNLIQKIDRLQIDDIDMDFISDYTFVDSTLYLICEKSGAGPLGERLYYLIKSNKDSSIEVLSSFVKPLVFNEHSISMSGMTLLEDKDILLYFNINYPFDGFVKKNASFLCRYDGQDLGLTTTEVVNEEVDHIASVSPNPAADYIQIRDVANSDLTNISIIDLLGNSISYKSNSALRLDISNLIPGNYFVRFYQNGKLTVLPFVKI